MGMVIGCEVHRINVVTVVVATTSKLLSKYLMAKSITCQSMEYKQFRWLVFDHLWNQYVGRFEIISLLVL